VEAADGQWVNIRAVPVARDNGPLQRPVEAAGRSASKDIAAAQGTEYVAYVDGAQTLTISLKVNDQTR
jgi:hypothetical protein